MWWLFSIHDTVYPIFALIHLISTINVNIAWSRIFLLGLVPGTTIQITFDHLVVAFILFIFFISAYSCLKVGQHIIKKIDPDYMLPRGMSRIDLIAL